MRRFAVLLLVLLVSALESACTTTVPASAQAQAIVDQSKAALLLFKARQKDSTALFRSALSDAKGVLIFPDLFEAAVGVGGAGGDGVMLVRRSDNTWGYPAFYNIGGGSLGVQLGAQTTEVFLLLMTDSAVKAVITSPTQIGFTSDATVGEVGVGGSSSTTVGSGSDIVGFSKGSGMFVGGALKGSYLSPLPKLNHSYYHNEMIQPRQILLENQVSNPGADSLRQTLLVE